MTRGRLRRRQMQARVVTIVAAMALLVGVPTASAKDPTPAAKGAEPARADGDHDRIADDLEAAIADAPPSQRFDVIIQFTAGASEENLAAAEREVGDLPARYVYREIAAGAVSATAAQIRGLARRPQTKRIDLDAEVTAFLATARDGFGVDRAVTDYNVNGSGVTIAVLDTGIDPGHQDLDEGKVVAFANCLSGSCTTSSVSFDDHGHGTHVASIAAGDGDASGGTHRGVAPAARLAAVKVLDRGGSGSMSGVDAGIEWVTANRLALGTRVLMNLSLGTSGCSDGGDSTAAVIKAAAGAGVPAFVAAGNSGPKTCTVASPAAAAEAITVGAMADPGDNDGSRPPGFSLADFSSRGPTSDGRQKPDVSAAGVDIRAAQSGTTQGYTVKSGTSMATPFAAGAGALALDEDPTLGVVALKSAMKTTAVDFGPAGTDVDYGAGRLDVHRLLTGIDAGTDATAPVVPRRDHFSGTLSSGETWETFTVDAVPGAPIAVTFVMSNWSGSSSPDFDIYLVDPQGATVANSLGYRRQETIGWRPPVAGTYQIKVHRYAGTGPFWMDVSYAPAVSSPAAPAAPTNLVATDAGVGGTVNLSWSASPDTDVAAYRLYRGASQVATISSPTVTYTDTGLVDGTSYTYTVTAVDGDPLESAHSAPATATPTDGVRPAAPAGLTATVDGTTVTVDWADSGGDVVQYVVRRDGSVVATPTASTFVDTGVGNGSHTYSVVAVDDGGLQSDPSTVSVTVDAPITLALSSSKVKSGYRVTLTWSGATGGTVRIFRNEVAVKDTANDGQHVDSVRKAGEYRYKVCEIGTGRCSPTSSITLT